MDRYGRKERKSRRKNKSAAIYHRRSRWLCRMHHGNVCIRQRNRFWTIMQTFPGFQLQHLKIKNSATGKKEQMDMGVSGYRKIIKEGTDGGKGCENSKDKKLEKSFRKI